MKLILFDLDGTLAEATKQIKSDMKEKLSQLKENNYHLGIVSGGTFDKINYQISNDTLFKYIFSENGMIGYDNQNKIFEKTLDEEFSSETMELVYKKINITLIDIFCRVENFIYKSTKIQINDIPKIEKRNSMLYLVPSGVSCNEIIRSSFMEIDSNEKIRDEIIRRLKIPLHDLGFSIKIGGNVGLAVCPLGWDKSYILSNKILDIDSYDKVYFYGDKCHPDGNDYPIFSFEGIEGYQVNCPEHTLQLLNKLLLKKNIYQTKVDCSKVYVDKSKFSTNENKFDGAFAKVDIKKGELVEKGLMRRLSDNNNRLFDGMKNPYVFTWSDDKPNYTWAFPSGCAVFYNSGLESQTNTKMIRYFNEDRFEIYATKDIQAGDELTHTYKSLEWREVFKPLYENLNKE